MVEPRLSRIWHWVKANAAPIGALAAVGMFILLLGPAFEFVGRQLQPDLLITVQNQRDCMPHDLGEWLRHIGLRSRAFADLLDRLSPAVETGLLEKLEEEHGATEQGGETASNKKAPRETFEELRKVLSNPIGEKALRGTLFGRLQRAEIRVLNQSNRTLSGVRLRFESLMSMFSVEASGTFFTKEEIDGFRNAIGADEGGEANLLELPPLKPNSELKLVIYASYISLFFPSSVQATVDNATCQVVGIQEVRGMWPIWLYHHPLFTIWASLATGLVLWPCGRYAYRCLFRSKP